MGVPDPDHRTTHRLRPRRRLARRRDQPAAPDRRARRTMADPAGTTRTVRRLARSAGRIHARRAGHHELRHPGIHGIPGPGPRGLPAFLDLLGRVPAPGRRTGYRRRGGRGTRRQIPVRTGVPAGRPAGRRLDDGLVSIMTLPPLTIATTPPTALMHQRNSLTTGIVHLGLGNFHRAHQAVYTAAALAEQDGPWGILGVASRSGAIAAAMRAQDLRYGVLEISPHSSKVTIPAVHTGAIVAADDPNVVVDAIGNPGTAIVTLTVTEHGYTYSPRTHRLDLDSPAVRADLQAGNPPTTTIGQIVRGLQRRAATHA